MLSRIYQRHSRAILWLVALSFPVLFMQAKSIPANNDIETWLPKESEVRKTYEQFKQDFGVEEVVLIGIDPRQVDRQMAESVCRRLDRLPGVRKCWSPGRLQAQMAEFGVSEAESRKRLTGLALAKNGTLEGLVVLLSDAGLKDRTGTVHDIKRELAYCQLEGEELCIAGAPVVVTELDRIGGQEENEKFFLITLIICLGLLYYWTNDWKLAISILGLTIWAIELTLTIFGLAGGEMNFILGALSVMVMVFTLEAAIHAVHYYRACRNGPDPLGEPLKHSWKPCCMSMLTTAIGLFSVSVSDILPVTQFGYASALGAVVAMVTGLVLTPALLTVLPQKHFEEAVHGGTSLSRLGRWLTRRSKRVVVMTSAVVLLAMVGITQLESRMDPLDFLPKNHKVRTDVERVENELTNIDSIEAVVDFRDHDLPFVERLRQVRELEARIRQHPAVRHTMSLATFFPEKLPDEPFALMQLLQKAESSKGKNEYIADNQRLWRISSRIDQSQGQSCDQVYYDLQQMLAGEPIAFTGIAPLLEQAQAEIFDGFWKSFASAFVVITLVMIVSLWSFRTAMLAMLPNLAPIGFVFGVLGWAQFPVDIGMMMTGSIALGITVDGTFHLLVRYQELCARGKSTQHAVRIALLTTGGPIFESIIVSSIGMFALALSSFAPTVRFGCLMATLLLVALVGDLILLPALLCLRGNPQVRLRAVPAPLGLGKSRTPRSTELPVERVA